jgi:ectoine hydroxylase
VLRLTDGQLEAYDRGGYVLLPGLLSDDVAPLRDRLPDILAANGPGRVLEGDGRSVRAVHGTHAHDELCARVVADERLLVPAQQLLGDYDLYVHQFKINAKPAFHGDSWGWHQDYVFWRDEDGMPEPRAVNTILFLDDVTEFNGPLLVMPGSHALGDVEPKPHSSTGDWKESFVPDLKYELAGEVVRRLADRFGLAAPKGPAGSVLFFHPQLVHGSAHNVSPYDRALLVVTYNCVANAPDPDRLGRPDFLAGRDFTPLRPLAREALAAR